MLLFFRDQLLISVFAPFQIILFLFVVTKWRNNKRVMFVHSESYCFSFNYQNTFFLILNLKLYCFETLCSHRKSCCLQNLTAEFDLFIKGKLHCHCLPLVRVPCLWIFSNLVLLLKDKSGKNSSDWKFCKSCLNTWYKLTCGLIHTVSVQDLLWHNDWRDDKGVVEAAVELLGTYFQDTVC